MEIVGHVLVKQGSHMTVNYITCHKNQVGALVIYHLHPSLPLCLAVVIAQMQVANHHHLHWL